MSDSSGSDGLSVLLDGVNALVDTLPSLLRALDAVAAIHPILQIAVGAFKVVIDLEVKRHDNDKKANLLFLEMRNMMTVLLQLQNVQSDHVGTDGNTIGHKLQGVVQNAAQDIKQCANACDAYARKRLLAKVFNAASWDSTFKDYIQRFSDRKAEFRFVISFHTGLGVDHANDKLDVLMAKVETVLEFFEKTVPHEHRILAEAIRTAGGSVAVLGNPNALEQLLAKEHQLTATSARSLQNVPSRSSPWQVMNGTLTSTPSQYHYSRAAESQRRFSKQLPSGGRDLGEDGQGIPRRSQYSTQIAESQGHRLDHVMIYDLTEEPAKTVYRNSASFERRFALQHQAMIREMQKVITQESNRVIKSFSAGPHERIIDRELSKLWQDMRWRCIVKARHLILAVHDYYTWQLDDYQRGAKVTPPSWAQIHEEDMWALRCLGLKRLQHIVEVLDCDASGYVTIQEVNQFTTSRPEGWSLLRWLAYWAIGWQLVMTEYKRKICTLLICMRQAAPSMRPQLANNQHYPPSSQYLITVEPLLRRMTSTFREDNTSDAHLAKFRGYVDEQEAIIRERLEMANYNIDNLDTVALVNGLLPLERNIFIILWLLLRRHYDIMRTAQKVLLHPEELVEAAASINVLSDAFTLRTQELTDLFAQRRLFVNVEMEDFACGMVSTACHKLRSAVQAATDTLMDEAGSDDIDASADVLSKTILRYPPFREDFYQESDDCIEEVGATTAEVADALKPLLGRWDALIQWDTYVSHVAYYTRFTYTFHACPALPDQLVASTANAASWDYTRHDVTVVHGGSGDDGRLKYRVIETWNSSALLGREYELTLSDDGITLLGWLKDAHYSGSILLVMKKTSSPEIMMYYPLTMNSQVNRRKALWQFALHAVLHDVRRRLSFRAFIAVRRRIRCRFVSLLRKSITIGTLVAPEPQELSSLYTNLTPADIRCFTHAALEPMRFPRSWMLPWCSTCLRTLHVDMPLLHCYSCIAYARQDPDARGIASKVYDCDDCITSHMRTDYWGPRCHLFLETRIAGWTVSMFTRENSTLTKERLNGLFLRAKEALVSGTLRSLLGRQAETELDGRLSYRQTGTRTVLLPSITEASVEDEPTVSAFLLRLPLFRAYLTSAGA
ncbi:hypothetical protein PYCCODRAFT_1513435 [Trametes coccinea BRFM310]|uniref:EF-hand domain-containing protein n=1 Tax=Trametes coccinea (strain BRFM310) TaxID=1353009 RepID=A0A1Y2IF49_TRAC3|nr:hypothetical protein PYCCODRAFT_1513435 [Trametes coccinea BRFM310]